MFISYFEDPDYPSSLYTPPLSLNSPYLIPFQSINDIESNTKEIESNNENFIQEKNIKYTLYPLYINWKKIESKNINNSYYIIFKIFGYFGVAIFNILKEVYSNDDEYGCNYENFLYELNLFYLKNYVIIEENIFFKKIINIYDDVISLIKNKIIIFKEISVFLIVMRLYEKYFINKNNNNKVIEVLKYEYKIIANINDEEYKKIYNKYFKKLNRECYDDFLFLGVKHLLPKTKKNYINNLRRIYKKINKDLSF